MSDAKDAIAEAMVRQKRLAAARLARKQELEAELARRKADRASLEGMPPDGEVDKLKVDLDARLAAIGAELSAVDGELASARAEIAELHKLAGRADADAARAVIKGATESDPVLRTPEEAALDNVRARAAELEASVKVQRELDEIDGADGEPPEPVPTKPKKTL